jgi:competence protein ComEA
MSAEPNRDWTTGPAKFAAAVVLGGASVAGMVWSVSTRPPASARAGAPIAAPRPATDTAPPGRAPAATGIDRVININTATAAELELLPGIGPAMAQRIVEHREARGPFRSVNELERVPGVGARTVERLRGKVTVE